MIKECPPGCVGFANPSGWMKSDFFIEWIEDFIKYLNCCRKSLASLHLDSHDSQSFVRALGSCNLTRTFLPISAINCSNWIKLYLDLSKGSTILHEIIGRSQTLDLCQFTILFQ